jgi:hypothetical protein
MQACDQEHLEMYGVALLPFAPPPTAETRPSAFRLITFDMNGLLVSIGRCEKRAVGAEGGMMRYFDPHVLRW